MHLNNSLSTPACWLNIETSISAETVLLANGHRSSPQTNRCLFCIPAPNVARTDSPTAETLYLPTVTGATSITNFYGLGLDIFALEYISVWN